jgi:tetrapyrrole methylase family protein/MazG family protein
LNKPENLRSFEVLVDIIAKLRSPQGCPWDRKQTHLSLREHLLEEAYEVLDALDAEDFTELEAELGDLLMQIVMHAQMASEEGKFDVNDVIEGINKKLVRRHPHVFGKTEARTAEEVLVHWEEIKKKERPDEAGILEGVPRTLPALAYSQSIQDRVSRAGFDWPEDTGVLEKLVEEIQEFKASSNQEDKENEFGDILFTLVNFARRQGIDPESALRMANVKFYRRFSRLEEIIRKMGKEISKMSLEEMNRVWDEVKNEDL